MLNDLWLAFVASGKKEISPEGQAAMRRVFYMGAVAVFKLIQEQPDDLQPLMAELDAFVREQLATRQ
jgi:hypothetical protein